MRNGSAPSLIEQGRRRLREAIRKNRNVPFCKANETKLPTIAGSIVANARHGGDGLPRVHLERRDCERPVP